MLEEAIGDRGLVVEGQLQRDVGKGVVAVEAFEGEGGDALLQIAQAALMPQDRPDQVASMKTVHREGKKHGKVRRAEREVHASGVSPKRTRQLYALVFRCIRLSAARPSSSNS